MYTTMNNTKSFVGFSMIASSLLVSGSVLAALPSTLSLADADAAFVGENSEDGAGFSLAGIGDVNGDGLQDMLVSAPQASGRAGRVYLIYGRSTGLENITDLAQADAAFVGEVAGDQAGMSISTLGDFNRDGLADFAIGAPFAKVNGNAGSGKVYVFFGSRTALSGQIPLSTAPVSITGEAAYGYAGMAVANLGDVNKDGYQDLGIGAYGMSSSAGKVYVVLGGSSSKFSKNMAASQFASFTGEKKSAYAGYSLAGVGDLNRDGYADFAIGSYGFTTSTSTSSAYAGYGKVYVVYGASTTWKANSPLAQVTSSFVGQAAKDFVGYSVGAAGDLNRDGYADFVIGAPGRDENGQANCGMVGLVYGQSTKLGAGNMGQVSARLIGAIANDNVGAKALGIGDVDGDSYPELFVSSHLSDEVGVDAGAAYVVRGAASKLNGAYNVSTQAMRLVGEVAYDNAGFSLANVGDVDGDGFADLFISALGNDEGGLGAGIAYLVQMGFIVDVDGDGYSEAMGDCGDDRADVHPGAYDIPGDGIDQDCMGGDAF